jgi:DNA mismatch repair protein PMS2
MASNNNTSQSCAPSCVIQFTIPNNAYDINLAPDKRQVYFTNEAEILKSLRDGLLQLWKGQTEGQFAVNNPKGLEVIGSQRSNDMKGYLHRQNIIMDDANVDINDDERIEIAVDVPKIDLLFDQNLDENKSATTTNNNETDQDEFIASRRYGFLDDPTVAANRNSNMMRKDRLQPRIWN